MALKEIFEQYLDEESKDSFMPLEVMSPDGVPCLRCERGQTWEEELGHRALRSQVCGGCSREDGCRGSHTSACVSSCSVTLRQSLSLSEL